MKFFEIKEKENRFSITKSGKYLFFVFNRSGRLEVHIERENSYVFIFGIFIGTGKEKFHLETVQHHKQGNTFSELLVKGVFFDFSSFYYSGLIRIEKGADKSSAYQKNQNLILSPHCHVRSEPYLEILANDVFCTHGSTTGRLREEQIYYLKTRGFPEEEAKSILIYGFLREVLDRLEGFLPSQKMKSIYQLVRRGPIKMLKRI